MWRAAAERIQTLSSPPGTILKPLGRDFFKRYQAANPRVRRVKQKPQELTRVISQEQDVIEDHFWEYKQVVDKLGLQPEDIWNMDECGTRISVGTAESPSETERELVTLVEAINALGQVIPPLCIQRGAVIMHQHVSKELNLNPNLLLRVSSSGYINDRLGMDYIYHFNKYIKLGRKRDRWRMLIFNSYFSKFTYDFIQFCWDRRIWPFLLLSHTTHILQPLDVAVFGPFKQYYKKRVE
ncbi:hypothetical protein K469DRAFT_631977, partial [Zopfia rhizophila CBS 207.26]